MSYAHLNGAQIYFDLYGAERPDRNQTPILLIHGATATGQSDWGTLVPLLARHYPVLVPDCRGHGRSTNPHQSYSFHEMAADIAELILRLGYER
ncbi:MAG TPA: alpha/beta fold hydrolase, partial [Anaerolineae bacterium]